MPIREASTDIICPICGCEAGTTHHIKPRASGGSDSPKNKVRLCRRCHDIVEKIYDETGLMYSPWLATYIRLMYDLVPTYRAGRGKTPEEKHNLDKRYTSDRIELCHCCGHKFVRPKPDDKLCPKCLLKFCSYPEFKRITRLDTIWKIRKSIGVNAW